MQNVKELFLQRKALREQYNNDCRGKRLPFFSSERKECKHLWWEEIKTDFRFDSEALQFAKKLHEGKITEAANTKAFDDVLSAQGAYSECERTQTLLCFPAYIPDGRGGTTVIQNCYYDKFCDVERRKVIQQVEEVLGR